MDDQKIDIKKVNTLADIPVKKDGLRGKSHNNVAEALVNLISRNEGGHAIGLEGSWGSGKSSVINITESLFEKKSEEYLFFTFDAWAHSGDPIRRSFLECLFGFLKSKKIVTLREWSARLRKIRAQEKRVTSETVPKIPGFNYVMVVYGLLLPFLIIWANDYYDSNNFKTLLLPTIVIVGIPIVSAIITKWYRTNHGSDEFKNIPILPSTRYLNHKSKTEQYIHTVDATTIEFNRYFDDLIKRITKKKKKLIVVVDNLDRLSSDDVKLMWGTMRNFFTSEFWGERHKLLKNVYLVVPYDRPYISKVFSEENNRNENDRRSIDGFIDKTFKYNFQVSAPILMDWKTYFEEKLDEAFENQLVSKQKFDLYKLFEFKFQTDEHLITPRRIKKFINELVVQVIEWDNKIPIKFLALYVLHRNQIKVNPRKVIEHELIQDERTRNYLEGEDWLKFIIAAYHKVNPDSALQIVMGNIIKQALVSHDNKILKKLQKEYDWFESILSIVVNDNSLEWARSEPKTLAIVAKTLNELEISYSHVFDDLWNNLATKVTSIGQIKKPDSLIANGLSLIITHSSDNLVEKVTKKLYESLYPEIKDETNIKLYAENFTSYIIALYNSSKKRVGDEKALKFLENITFPNYSRFNVYFAGQVHQTGINFQNFKSAAFTIDGFNKEIIEIISNESIEIDLEQSLTAFIFADKELDWDKIAEAIVNRINTNQPNFSSYELGIFMMILFLLEYHSKGDASVKLSKLSSDGILTALIEKSEGDALTTSLIILELLAYYELIDDIPSIAKVPTYGNNTTGLTQLKKICQNPNDNLKIIEHLSNYACEFASFQTLLNATKSNRESYPLVEKVALKMIDNGCVKGIRIPSIIEDFELLDFVYQNEVEEIFYNLVDQQDYEIGSISDLKSISDLSLQEHLRFKTNIGSSLISRIKDYFIDLDQEQWRPILEEERHEVNLLFVLIDNNIVSFLSENFSKSFLGISSKILEEDIQLNSFEDRWGLLAKAIAPSTRTTFYERFFDKVVQYRDNNVFHLLSSFDDEFIQSVKIEDKADPFIKNVVSELINSDEIQQLSWVEDNIDIVVKSYKKSEKESCQYLNEIMDSKHNEDPKIKDKVNNISGKLGIELDWNEDKSNQSE